MFIDPSYTAEFDGSELFLDSSIQEVFTTSCVGQSKTIRVCLQTLETALAPFADFIEVNTNATRDLLNGQARAEGSLIFEVEVQGEEQDDLYSLDLFYSQIINGTRLLDVFNNSGALFRELSIEFTYERNINGILAVDYR